MTVAIIEATTSTNVLSECILATGNINGGGRNTSIQFGASEVNVEAFGDGMEAWEVAIDGIGPGLCSTTDSIGTKGQWNVQYVPRMDSLVRNAVVRRLVFRSIDSW